MCAVWELWIKKNADLKMAVRKERQKTADHTHSDHWERRK